MKTSSAILSFLCSLALFADVSTAQWTKTGFPNVSAQNAVNKLIAVPRESGGPFLFAGAFSRGVFSSADSGTTWAPVTGGPPSTSWVSDFTVVSNNGKGSRLFVVTQVDGIYETTDCGLTWSWPSQTHPGNGFDPLWDVAAVETTLFLGTDPVGVYRRNFNAPYWTPSGLAGQSIRKLLACPDGAGGMSLLAWVFIPQAPGILFRSTDLGKNWHSTNLSSFPSDFAIYDNGVSGVKIFAGTINGVFCSTDYGEVWTAGSADLGSERVNAFAVHKTGSNSCTVFAGTHYNGVFVSYDAGTTWQAFNTGLAYTGTQSLLVFGGYLYAGTGGGIWKRPLSDATVAVNPTGGGTPRGFLMESNYPNPFNPGTTIRYSLAERSRVTLTIFNSLGQHVATLVEKEEEAGSHAAVFDGSGLASGVYICRLQAGAFVQSSKLLLLR